MLVDLHLLPDHSRIWIYQSSRALTKEEVSFVTAEFTQFCNNWMAHGHPLRTSFKIVFQQFILLAADEDYHLPSGCSIDSSVRLLKDIQAKLKVDFFDRTRIAFLVDGEIITHRLPLLAEMFNTGILNGSSITFDNLVPSLGDYNTRWEVPAEKTWLVKYLQKSALKG